MTAGKLRIAWQMLDAGVHVITEIAATIGVARATWTADSAAAESW
jgi:hypothetical protein